MATKFLIDTDDFVMAFEVLPITDEIAIQGGLYRRNYFKSHHVGLADAIIAATATIHNATLVTFNQKHFPMIATLETPYQKT